VNPPVTARDRGSRLKVVTPPTSPGTSEGPSPRSRRRGSPQVDRIPDHLEARPVPVAAQRRARLHHAGVPIGCARDTRREDGLAAALRGRLLPRPRPRHHHGLQHRVGPQPSLIPQPPRAPRRRLRGNRDTGRRRTQRARAVSPRRALRSDQPSVCPLPPSSGSYRPCRPDRATRPDDITGAICAPLTR
jgi:hypothetical protein